MPVSVAAVLAQAQQALNDADGVRWTVPELFGYLKDGLLDIAVEKPTAFGGAVEMDLVAGTYQTIPDTYTTLIGVTRNLTSPAGAGIRLGGRAITPVARSLLDAQFLDWHDALRVPFSPIVMHVVTDLADPRGFYVFPGNTGTGRIEAIVGRAPVMPEPGDTAGDASTYTDPAPIDAIYSNALREYMLFRAHSKNVMLNGSPSMAQAHYGLYASAIGKRAQVEGIANVNTQKARE